MTDYEDWPYDSSPDDVEPLPDPPRWPIWRRPYLGDFIFEVAKGHLNDAIGEEGWLQVILLKASWKWLWLKRRGIGPHPAMKTVDDLFLRGRNQECDFGGYKRRREHVQSTFTRREFGVQTNFEITDAFWECSDPMNDIGWLVIATPSGQLVTAHQFRVTTDPGAGSTLEAKVGRFGFAVTA